MAWHEIVQMDIQDSLKLLDNVIEVNMKDHCK